MKTSLKPLRRLLCVALAWPVLSVAAPASPADAAALVERGAYLARLGDCIACHSAPGGKAFAGGLPMKTPVGTIYSTNITPDVATGIGRWTASQFEGALRRGLSRDGHNLYPAMPYPSYAKMRDDDVDALYAYFMKGVAPVRQANRPADMGFPLDMRWPLKLWNLFFLRGASYIDQPGRSAEWNRGAYLTQGLGHCGACHTPRGFAFQEKALAEDGASYLAGAELDGWFASNLRGEPRAGLGRWNRADLQAFLRVGANRHASAFGPMTEVVNNSTQHMSEGDLRAMSTYLLSLPGAGPGGGRNASAAPATVAVARLAAPGGARLYGQYCANCHGVQGQGAAPWLAPLAGNPNLGAPSVSSLINVTLNGSHALVIGGVPAAYPMPAFGALLGDRDMAQLLSFARAAWGQGATGVTATEVAKVRRQSH